MIVMGRDRPTLQPIGGWTHVEPVVGRIDIDAEDAQFVREIAEMVRQILEATPPELASDIIEAGIALCGGGCLLRGMDEYLTQETGVFCYRVEDPLSSVALGAERLFSDPRLMRAVFNGQQHGSVGPPM